jgi:predicted nucleic acid-binding Zn ribbon protein
MNYFDAKKARRYWLLAALVFIAIVVGWFLPLSAQQQLLSQEVQVVLFALGLIFTFLAVACYALQYQPKPIIWSTVFALFAVGVLLLVRLDAPERSHLLEYAALAIFTHKAIHIRYSYRLWEPGIRAVVLAGGIGFFDEAMQAILPNRHFAWEDVVFNSSAVVIAIGGHVFIKAIQKGKLPKIKPRE